MSKTSIVPLKLEHLMAIPSGRDLIERGLADQVLGIDSVAVISGDMVMLCFGIGLIWPGRGHVWGAFNVSSDAKRNFVPTFRAVKRWFHERLKSTYHRIEMSIDYGLEISERRARLWGFTCEIERARMILPDGKDASIYILVRE